MEESSKKLSEKDKASLLRLTDAAYAEFDRLKQDFPLISHDELQFVLAEHLLALYTAVMCINLDLTAAEAQVFNAALEGVVNLAGNLAWREPSGEDCDVE